ncbi:shikimate dehydrogenase [Alphaproteobacteria bacterium]|nr:shikimate dehydrogenase [Alphaproteobacteria bacterium]
MNNIIGIVAEKLGHTLSPYIHNYWSNKYNKNFKYKKFALKEKDLKKFFQTYKKNKKFKGFNVTIPYKTNFISLCDKITSKAKKIGSVNLVYKKNNLIIGDNTDVIGFEKSFKLLNKISTKNVLLIGAGGAARAVLYFLNKKNIENIDVFATSLTRKEDICKDFTISNFVTKTKFLNSKYDLIINSSSGGMVGKSPLNKNILKLVDSAQGIIDIVYNPEMTALLRRAKKTNTPYVGGLSMLIEQAKPSFEKWTNTKIKINEEIYNLARSKLQ